MQFAAGRTTYPYGYDDHSHHTAYEYDAGDRLTLTVIGRNRRIPQPVKQPRLRARLKKAKFYGYDAGNRLSGCTCDAGRRNPFKQALVSIDRETLQAVNHSRLTAVLRQAHRNPYTYGTYIDEPLAMYRPGQSPLYYAQNELYSVSALTNGSGNVVEQYEYEAFGGLIGPSSTNGNPWTFTGRRLDEESGLIDYRARMYDVDVGRFITRDPTG